MYDSADPLDGWNFAQILRCTGGSGPNDLYGKLFASLKHLLNSFVRQVSSRSIGFELWNLDVNDLPKHLKARKFARIEVTFTTTIGDKEF